MPVCRGCGADIEFLVSKTTRKPLPVDVGSLEKRVAVVSVSDDGEKEARVLDTYISHFATCPAADQFRKKD